MNNIAIVSILFFVLLTCNAFKASEKKYSFRQRAASWTSSSKSEKTSSWRSCLPNKKRSMSEDVVEPRSQKGLFAKKIVTDHQDDEPYLFKIKDKISLSQSDLRTLRDELYKYGLPYTHANIIHFMNLDILSEYHDLKFPLSLMEKKQKEERNNSGAIDTPTSLIPGNSARSIHTTVVIKNKTTYSANDIWGRSIDTMITVLTTIQIHKLL
ncbi:MAG: hypothetical protein ACXWL5_00540 [Candidatus Chromulinivorax sp.]